MTPYDPKAEGFNPRTGVMIVTSEFLDDVNRLVGDSLFGTFYTHDLPNHRHLVFVSSNHLPEPGWNGGVKLTISKTFVNGYTRNGYVEYVFHPHWEKDDSVVIP